MVIHDEPVTIGEVEWLLVIMEVFVILVQNETDTEDEVERVAWKVVEALKELLTLADELGVGD